LQEKKQTAETKSQQKPIRLQQIITYSGTKRIVACSMIVDRNRTDVKDEQLPEVDVEKKELSENAGNSCHIVLSRIAFDVR
jgi:hypothetical protein